MAVHVSSFIFIDIFYVYFCSIEMFVFVAVAVCGGERCQYVAATVSGHVQNYSEQLEDTSGGHALCLQSTVHHSLQV